MRKRPGCRNLHWPGRGGAPGRSVPGSVAGSSAVDAQTARRDTLDGVVQIIAHVPQDARTASTLGTERQGTGVVIDDSGLVLTIGYLVLEAMEIQIQAAAPDRCRRGSSATITRPASVWCAPSNRWI